MLIIITYKYIKYIYMTEFQIKKYKPIIHVSWSSLLLTELLAHDLSKPVELFIDVLPSDCTIKTPNALKVYLANEPKELLPHIHQHLLDNNSNYDLIFTWEHDLLSLGKANIKHYMFFHRLYFCYLDSMPYNVCGKKEFNISTVVGQKYSLSGHKLRHELWERKDEITIPTNFYKSSNGTPIPGEGKLLGGKNELFDHSQFSIAIENVDSPNMYTEKINDCMLAKTVPVYWGASNIGEVYNTDGIIQVSSIDDLIKKVNSLTPETYENMKPYIEDNYQRALKLSKIRLGDIIEKELHLV